MLEHLLAFAAIIGDTVNYWIGRYMGKRILAGKYTSSLDRTQKFYDKHGGKTIILARFIPIIRTFAPFVAGMGSMSYFKFIVYNITGGVLWVLSLVAAGHYFGNIPIVKKNFTLVIMVIIFLSILPGIIAWLQSYLAQRKMKAATAETTENK